MNKVQKRIRNIYLAEVIGDKRNIDFSSGDEFCKLWRWAQKQYWWDKKDFHKYLRKNRVLSDPLVNSIYKYLKDSKGE